MSNHRNSYANMSVMQQSLQQQRDDGISTLPHGIEYEIPEVSAETQKLYMDDPHKARKKLGVTDQEIHEGWIKQCRLEKFHVVE